MKPGQGVAKGRIGISSVPPALFAPDHRARRHSQAIRGSLDSMTGRHSHRILARSLMAMGALTVTTATLVRSQESTPTAPTAQPAPNVAALFDA